MTKISSRFCRVSVSLMILTTSLTPGSAQAADRPVRKLDLLAGQGIVLDFDSDVTRVYSSNPEIADPAVSTAREVLLNGKALGIATMVVWLQSGARETFAVRISSDLETARSLLRDTFPAENITLHGSKDGISLVGRVSTQEVSDRAVALLKPVAQSVVSNLQIAAPRGLRQIGLKVIFAEVNRKATEQFGINLLSTGGKMPGAISTGQFPGLSPTASGTTLNLSDALNVFAFRPDLNLAVTIKALEQQGLLQILAEPNLVTSEGKEARFTVGGEFPVPVPQAGAAAGAITIQFREFGIRLSFLPTMTPNGTIRLHVLPEVSAIDIANGVTLNGFNIPALTTRRIETDIELREGQSFAIAGLLDDRVTENLSRVPGLASIPFFGALFRSRDLVKSQTELIVLVTPSVRYPLPDGDALPLPVMPSPFLPQFPKSTAAPRGPSFESGGSGLQEERQAIYREERQRTLVRSLIGMFEATAAAGANPSAAMRPAKPSDVLTRQLEELSARYGSQHPDVIKAADVLALALVLEEDAEKAAAAAKEKIQ